MSHAALVLAQPVHALRPDATEAELLLFSRVANEFIGSMPDDVLRAASEAFARRGRSFTATAIRSFFVNEPTFHRRPSPRAAADSAAEKQQADWDLIHKKQQVIIGWEREHDDAESAHWIGQASRCAPRFLDEVIAEWRAAGRGQE